MEDNYAKAYKEVIEILKYVPEKSVNKIPENMLKMFEIKMDKEYEFKIDEDKSFEEQNLLDETKAIFANIFRDYWATPEQREKIIAKEKYDRQKIEEEKLKKYNPDDIFKNRRMKSSGNEEIKENNNLPAEVKKEGFYQKLITFIKKIFHM